MAKITVGFSKAKSPWKLGSKLIRWWMDKPFSHTFLMFSFLKFNDKTIYEATGIGLTTISLNHFLKKSEVVKLYEIEVSDEQYFDILNRCNDAAGTEYAYLQNLGYVISRLLRLKTNPFKKGVNCSEWVAECIIAIDPEAFSEFEDLNLVSPGHVFDYLEKKYGKTETN